MKYITDALQRNIDKGCPACGARPAPCPTCGAAPCVNPSFCKGCRDADQRHRQKKSDLPDDWDSMSLDALWHALDRAARHRNPAPELSTVAAIICAVQQRGLAALKEPATAERLGRCTPEQRADIKRRITAMRSK